MTLGLESLSAVTHVRLVSHLVNVDWNTSYIEEDICCLIFEVVNENAGALKVITLV